MTGGMSEPDPGNVLAAIGWRGREFERITEGWDNLIWRFVGEDGRVHGLRMARPREDNSGARAAMAREVAVLEAVAGSGLPVPVIEARGEFEGAPFMVQRWLAGVPLMKRVRERPWLVGRLAGYMGRLQARLHTLPVEGLAVLPEREWVRRVEPLAPDLVEVIRREARMDAVCHMDLHPLNVLVNHDRISGVVDWTNATVADRRMDLARTDAILTLVPVGQERLRLLNAVVRKRFVTAWRKGYEREAREWPLTPAFRAFGAVHHFYEMDRAVREGRGWVTAEELEAARRGVDERLAEVGLSA